MSPARSETRTGKNGGRMKVPNASSRPMPSSTGPCTSKRAPERLAGTKKGSPWTWSQCMWVTRAWPRNEPSTGWVSPKKRRPVPRSSTIGSVLGDSMATQAVLPP